MTRAVLHKKKERKKEREGCILRQPTLVFDFLRIRFLQVERYSFNRRMNIIWWKTLDFDEETNPERTKEKERKKETPRQSADYRLNGCKQAEPLRWRHILIIKQCNNGSIEEVWILCE
jgi:hypothetical protein